MALHHGIYTQRFRTYAELKSKIPSAPDGVYALFPNGPGTPASVAHCITYKGEHYQAMWSQFGGPQASTFGTNVSNATLHANKATYDGIIQPYDEDGEMYSRINNVGYSYWSAQTDVTWFKRTRSYNSSGTLLTTNNHSHEVLLSFENGATYAEAFDINAGYKALSGTVSMTWTQGIEGTVIDYGSTGHLYSYATSIGFANETDNNGGAISTVMGNGSSYYSSAGWEARHVLSYNHETTGRDTVRCQFVCWGSENAAMEQIWYVKFNNE